MEESRVILYYNKGWSDEMDNTPSEVPNGIELTAYDLGRYDAKNNVNKTMDEVVKSIIKK